MYFESRPQNYSNLHNQSKIEGYQSSRYDNQGHYNNQQKFEVPYNVLKTNPFYDPRRQINNNFSQFHQKQPFRQIPTINFVKSNQKDHNSPHQKAYIGYSVSNPAYLKKNQFFKSRQTTAIINDQLKYKPNFSPNPKDDFSIKKHYIGSTIGLKSNQNQNNHSEYNCSNISNTSIGQRYKDIPINNQKNVSSQNQNNKESQYSSISPFKNQDNYNFSQIHKNDNSKYQIESEIKQKNKNTLDCNYQSQFQCSQLRKNDYKFTTPMNSKRISQIQVRNEYSGIIPSQIKTITQIEYKTCQNPTLNRSSSSYMISNDIKSKFERTLQSSKLLRRESCASSQSNNLKSKNNKKLNQLNQEEQKQKENLKVQIMQTKELQKKQKQKVLHLQKIIDNKNQTIAQLQKLIEQMKKRQNNNEQLGQLVLKLKQKTLFAQNLQFQLQKHKNILEEKQTQLNQLQKALSQMQKIKTIQQAKCKILKQQLNNLQKEKNAQSLRHQAQITHKLIQIGTKTLELNKMEQQIHAMQVQNQNILKTMLQKNSNQDNEMKKLKDKNDQLKNRFQGIFKENQTLHIQMDNIEKQLISLKQQKKVFLNLNSNLESHKTDLSHKIQYLQKKMSRLQKQVENKQLKIQNLEKIGNKNTNFQQSANIKTKIFQQQLQFLKQKILIKDNASNILQDQLNKKTKQIQMLIFQKGQLLRKAQQWSLKQKEKANQSQGFTKNKDRQASFKQKIDELVDQLSSQKQKSLRNISQLNGNIQMMVLKENQLKQKIVDIQNQHQLIIQRYQQELDLLIQQKKTQQQQAKYIYQTRIQVKNCIQNIPQNQNQSLLLQYHKKYFQIASYFNIQNFNFRKIDQSLTDFNLEEVQKQQLKGKIPNSNNLNQIHQQLKQQIQRIHKDLKKLVLVLKDNQSEHLKLSQKVYDCQKNNKKIGLKLGQVHAQLHLKNILIQQINKKQIQNKILLLNQKYKKQANE